ncbi:hypothetical protein [Burkholderia metallica]|nr:hypothetical protein [Burkholderia metallica]
MVDHFNKRIIRCGYSDFIGGNDTRYAPLLGDLPPGPGADIRPTALG